MTFEIASISFIQTEVGKVECIDMHAVLTANGMWLILEGFVNGYAATETGVNRLHVIIHDTIQPESAVIELITLIHDTIQPESAVIELNTLVQDELATLFN